VPAAPHLPLPALLSAALVAFTIEFDNEAEHRMPHRTTNYGAAGRRALEALAVGPDGQRAPLFRGLEPYPDNWRASVRPPTTLPYYPVVLHRGGYPDGSRPI
jgi:hypothetical protein